HRRRPDPMVLGRARRTADALLDAMSPDGFLAGRFRNDWSPAVGWSCLTGSVQIASCWFILSEMTGEDRYRDAAFLANRYVRRTMRTDGVGEIDGGVKGAFPFHGGYGAYEYVNWACKFMIDANLQELEIPPSVPSSQPWDRLSSAETRG
ncbi:MAG: hypothetical protein KC729_17790, partial [Candidatus Eisenbacteria bacterium]|nr:hypothetical protein [Candidatus Eisenbacteria bacterium]